jgi:adenylate cyclase
MWLLASLLFSDFPVQLREFLITLGVGGVLTSALIFLASEVIWRPVIPFFLPDGQLRAIGAFRISVRARLVGVFLLITLYPAGMLTLVVFDRTQLLLTAPNPQAILQNMLLSIGFIFVISLVASLGMAILVARLIIHPLNGLEEAMQKVEQGLLDVSVPVYSNDEIGYLTERFNEMIGGLKRAELLRTLLNLYVSPEVARNAVEHGTALGGQVVECSVLFSDIRGFTTLSETLPPAELIDLLNRYMSVMVDVIVSQGGMVNKFGGDSLLAVFGTPLNPSPKHVARAVRAAQAMFTALAQFNAAQCAQNAPELKIGIGLASGPVVAGNIGGEGRIEYTVIGDTVNLASRLQSMTKEVGQDILMNEKTLELAQAYMTLAVEPLPSVAVRGKAEAVMVYALGSSSDLT